MRFEHRQVGQSRKADEPRQADVQVAPGTAREEQQHAERHQPAADKQVYARFGKPVFVRTTQDADPEQQLRRQRHQAETVEEPVVHAFLQQRLQRLDPEGQQCEPEHQIGHPALGQRPRNENLDHVKAEYGGVDQQCGRHDIVQQYVEDASAAAFGTGPTVVHHQEKHRAGESLERISAYIQTCSIQLPSSPKI